MIHRFDHLARFAAPFRKAFLLLLTALVCIPLTHAAPGDTCTPPPSGMVSWWPGDEAPLGVTPDIASGNNAGTLVGGSIVTDGNRTAFSFDGSGAHVVIPDHASLRPSGLTIDAWINLNVPHDGIVIAKTSSGNRPYAIGVSASGLVIAVAGNLSLAPGNSTQLSGSIGANVWRHVAYTFDDAANKDVLYVDGVAVATSNPTFSLGYDGDPVKIGAQGSTNQYPFNGLIDEVEIFDRALSAAEIQAIYEAGDKGKCKGQLCATPPLNMVSWYRAEGDGIDSQGTNDGTLNSVGSVPGKVGQAYNFTGGNGPVQVADGGTLDVKTAISIDAWIFPTGSDVNAPYAIVNKYISSTGDRGYDLFLNNQKLVFFVVGQGEILNDGCFLTSVNNVNFGQWNHVAATADSTDCRIYLNGQLEQSPDTTGALGVSSIQDNSVPFSIGWREGGVSHPFVGLIDEVEVFNRALSATEIKEINDAGVNGKCGGCVEPPDDMTAWYRAEDNPFDSIGSNDGTLQGNATFADGVVGQAFSFDGNGDYVDLGTANLLGGATQITLDAWVYPTSFSDYMGIVYPSDNRWWMQILQGSGIVRFAANYNVSNTFVDSQTAIPLNQWSHVAGTWDGNTLRIFINGVQDNTAPATGLITDDAGLTKTIGSRGGLDQFFSGRIDEVEFFSRALSSAEIAGIYCAGSRGKCVSSDRDFGDAPSTYPTLLANNGARHMAIGPRLGATRDAEVDGQPLGLGDDTDEDGITTVPITLTAGVDKVITVAIGNAPAPAGAYLNAWVDFGNDNSWSEAGDRVVVDDLAVTTGNSMVTVPAAATVSLMPGTYHARLRICGTANSCDTPLGEAADGEVEDYAITVSAAVVTTFTTIATPNATLGQPISDTATLAGATNPTGTITFTLYGPNNATCVGATIFTSTATVNGNGNYASDPYIPTAVGTYRWIASYSGDANNNAIPGVCNDANETSTVTTVPPSGGGGGGGSHDKHAWWNPLGIGALDPFTLLMLAVFGLYGVRRRL